MKPSMKASLPVAAAALVAIALSTARASSAQERPNVLFIVVDDLNDWVGYLGGNPQVRTPNLDRLARRGVRFTHAYAPAPVCNPSRAAVLSGLRPATTGVYDNEVDSRPIIPAARMLTAQFRDAGYFVAGAGKISHRERDSDWDEYQKSKDPPWPHVDPLFAPGAGDVADENLADYRDVSWVIDQLQKKHDRPLFLACGIRKPHTPWNVPRRYYDRYPLDAIKLPPFLDDDLEDLPPAGVDMALRAPADVESARQQELMTYWRTRGPGGTLEGDHERMVRLGLWKEAIQGYLASIAFMDMNLGRLLEALDASPHRENTIVVLWSDHGWHLGEKHHWRKFSLWEEATRAPLLWIVPGVTKPDSICDRTVDFMSLYPTLLDLTGIPIPEHVEGRSLRRLLEDPAAPWEQPALTTYLFGNHAVRSERWRYIRYHDGGEELYDEERDPLEWVNLAAKPELAPVKSELAKYLPVVNAPALKADAVSN